MNSNITSSDNSFIKHIVKLVQKKSYRDEYKHAVIYGEKSITEAYNHGVVTDILVSEECYVNYKKQFDNEKINWHCIENQKIFDKINLLNIECNLIAVIKQKEVDSIQDFYHQNCIILDDIQDPGNLGTILRTAQAVGIHHIILSKNSVDLYNSKVLRATMGIQFQLNIIQDVILSDFLAAFTHHGGQVVCCCPNATKNLYHHNFQEVNHTALVFGNEGHGISQDITTIYQNSSVYIPMDITAESLNIATAVAVIAYEFRRQLNFLR